MQTSTKQVKGIAAAIAAAFSTADLSPEEMNSSTLQFNDLPWNWPPLVCDTELDKVPLSYYFDSCMKPTSEEALHSFWSHTLEDIYRRKSHVIKNGVFHQTGKVFKQSTLGQRAFCFSLPSGFPSATSDTAGVEFSLEAAHVALNSCAIVEKVSDEDNYYVVTSEGFTIGVKDGVPAISSNWDMPATGMVQEMLHMSRGNTDYLCLYDQVARCRSLIYEFKPRFKDFEGLDFALQALRKMTFGIHCPVLINARQTAAIDINLLKAQEMSVRQAIEIMREPNIGDRRKLHALEDLLVPLVIPKTAFLAKVYNTNAPIPFAITDKAVSKILTYLHDYYQGKVPDKLKHETLASEMQ